ncbi:hypothetical protein [Rugosimonospora africana]|uniref:hypothetical protein n=1 Tax=Rugosimonospora africana TaxID=556532 RepID=UPI001944FB8B|nr:hypothetical protein [Rugosimonospora africana]
MLITSWVQTRSSDRQRRYDRALRFYEDKKDVYVRYPVLVSEIRNIVAPILRRTNEINARQTELLAVENRRLAIMETNIAALERINEDIAIQTDKLRDQLGHLPDEASITVDAAAWQVLDETNAALNDGRSELATLSDEVGDGLDEIWSQWLSAAPLFAELDRANNVIALYSSPEVVAAADKLRSTMGSAPIADYMQAVEAFRVAARRDLQTGTW